MKHYWSRFLCILAVTGIASGCNSLDPPLSTGIVDQAGTQADAMVLAANAKLIGSDSGLAINAVTDDALILSITDAQATPAPGQVLVSTDGEWILRRVISIEPENQGLVRVLTQPASLEEAFVELHLEGEGLFLSPDENSTITDFEVESKVYSGSAGVSFNKDYPLSYTGSGWSLGGNANVNGSLSARISLDISGAVLQSALFEINGSAGLNVVGTITANAGFSSEKRLTPQGVKVGCIPTNIPAVCIPVFLNAYVGLSATASATIGFNVGASGSITAGVRKSNSTWSPSLTPNFTPTLAVTSVSLPTLVSGEVYARARISAFSSNGNGPWVDLKLPKIAVTTQRVNGRPRVCLAPKLGAGVGFSLPTSFFGISLPSASWNHNFPERSLSSSPTCRTF